MLLDDLLSVCLSVCLSEALDHVAGCRQETRVLTQPSFSHLGQVSTLDFLFLATNKEKHQPPLIRAPVLQARHSCHVQTSRWSTVHGPWGTRQRLRVTPEDGRAGHPVNRTELPPALK